MLHGIASNWVVVFLGFWIGYLPVLANGKNGNQDLKIEKAHKHCKGLDYREISVREFGGNWKIIERGIHPVFEFGAEKALADQALSIFKRLRTKVACFAGNPNPYFIYILGEDFRPISISNSIHESCKAFNTNSLEILQEGKAWVLSDKSWKFAIGSSKKNAEHALRLIKKHRFNNQCFIGNGTDGFYYWKKIMLNMQKFGGEEKPDLTGFGDLKIGSNGGIVVKWDTTVSLNNDHIFMITPQGYAAVNIYYAEKNIGKGPAKGYTNRWKFDGVEISKQVNRPQINPEQVHPMQVQAYLKISEGEHTLEFSIDDEHIVDESEEDNNRFQLKIKFGEEVLTKAKALQPN